MYYTFTSHELGILKLHWDAESRKLTNMRNGKSTVLRFDITEWAYYMGLTMVSKSETFC